MSTKFSTEWTHVMIGHSGNMFWTKKPRFDLVIRSSEFKILNLVFTSDFPDAHRFIGLTNDLFTLIRLLFLSQIRFGALTHTRLQRGFGG